MAQKYIFFAFLIFQLFTFSPLRAQQFSLVRENPQKAFPETVPAANYSGITWLGDTLYAVVDDKSKDDGYEMFSIALDSLSGDITSVKFLGHVAGEGDNRDQEGIAYVKDRETLLVSGEADDMIREYTLDGKSTGRNIILPSSAKNSGYEALTYQPTTRTIWTISEGMLPSDGDVAKPGSDEGDRLRLLCFDCDMKKVGEYAYQCDPPTATIPGMVYAGGVSALAAADSGTLLVLEREVYVPEIALGAYALCRIYEVAPPIPPTGGQGGLTEKHLLCQWKTSLSLFRSTLANYEGMCFGPTLSDGSRVVVLVSDSQGGYGGVLKDFFKTIVVKETPAGEPSALPSGEGDEAEELIPADIED